MEKYWAVLIAWCGGTREDAEDVAQAAFVKLAVQDPIPSNCVGWLFTVTKHLAINARLSQSKRYSRELRVAVQRSHNDSSVGNTSELDLRDLLDQLDAREREIVVARIWGGLSFEQIAGLYGDSKATVWRVYQSGITKLRAIYQE